MLSEGHVLEPQNIFVTDETGIDPSPKMGSMIAPKGAKLIFSVTSQSTTCQFEEKANLFFHPKKFSRFLHASVTFSKKNQRQNCPSLATGQKRINSNSFL